MSAKIAAAKQAALVYDGEDVERCRQARRAFEKRFKTLDAMFDYCERLRKRRGVKTAKAPATGKPKPAARNSKPAPGKAVHEV
jgi:hypothetical protein